MKLELVESFGNALSENMIIESENITALEYLQEEFSGKIDVITIDPPYNTDISHIGYRDSNFENGWSTFIKERLALAKILMSDAGSMFINIDENELVSLLEICYDLFGKENVNILVWPKIDEPFDMNRVEKPVFNIKSAHEYIVLCYMDKKNTVFSNMRNGKPMESIIKGLGTTSSAKDEIAQLLGKREMFSTPKPMRLLEEIIRISSQKDSIILDFFAGSGTTGHATMSLNKFDGGRRKFILVTNDENDICKNVTIPRIKKSIEVYNYRDGFNYYKLRSRYQCDLF
ncbi:MAG: putative methyltransferase [Methanomassiliicoccales archaeon PtaU1.Bin124]|nr:MAG: putative methyltransferase [Methanomassiliicoccales archaeon PtaU1.Bin124]